MSAPASEVAPRLHRLAVVTLYLTERCNSRCVTCEYWQHGRDDMSLTAVRRMLPDLRRLNTDTVLLSGGEPLLNPEWAPIAEALRANGQKVWLLTSGLALAKHAPEVARRCDHVTVSLDGTDPTTYRAIRGLDAFDKVCAGIRACAALGRAPGLRVTLQRANYRQLADFIALAKALQAASVSFLAVDVANTDAFGRREAALSSLALGVEDLAPFGAALATLCDTNAADFESGFIAESPEKLANLLQYFRALQGLDVFPAVHCNAPQFSAVIDPRGRLQPCFFIAGPAEAQATEGLFGALNVAPLRSLRSDIAEGRRAECKSCVCALWRDPDQA